MCTVITFGEITHFQHDSYISILCLLLHFVVSFKTSEKMKGRGHWVLWFDTQWFDNLMIFCWMVQYLRFQYLIWASVAEWLRLSTSNHLSLTVVGLNPDRDLWILSCEEAIQLANMERGSTQVPICAWNNERKSTWDLPPPLKLEHHLTYTVSVWHKTQTNKTEWIQYLMVWYLTIQYLMVLYLTIQYLMVQHRHNLIPYGLILNHSAPNGSIPNSMTT
jgi:hypothetical protein